MKPLQKAIKKARESVQKRQQFELDRKEFNMCLDERICPKCAELLDVKPVNMGRLDYKCSNSACSFTHYREANIVPAEGQPKER